MPKPTFRKKSVDDDNNISKFSDEKISVGDIRKTQVITTFGVGSIVDFKDDTVIIASTDDWDYPPDSEEVERRKIFNENLSVITEAEYFLMPKTSHNTNNFSKGKNITSYVFPEKLHCSRCGNIYDFRELNIKDRHKCPQCKNNLNASRFIVVCTRGHMDDFPYDWWVHNGKPCPSGVKSPRIKMVNIYNRTDIDSLRLECTECKTTRSMVQVFSENALSEFRCTCKHPHFKNPYARVQYGCNDKMRARLRSASGVYFPITKAALLIPPWSRKDVSCIQKNYEIIKAVEEVDENKVIFAIRKLIQNDTVSDEEIMRLWKDVKFSKEHNERRSELSVYEDEYAVLSKESNSNEDKFSSYTSAIPERYHQFFKQLVVVDKLTVTQAFTGFTRITRNESNRVAISQYPKPWLPAVELTGEGIFIRFNNEKISQWRKENSSRYRRMKKAMEDSKFTLDTFSETYVMLHTFAHLFIREISNICGYSAASIREKIYSEISDKDEVKMCGVLIFVSSSDSDSSLGGLISIADNKDIFEKIMDSMLERASWCSGDPLCISSMKQGYKNLNYAACHDCTLLPETSCERFNCFLDRASIVGLPDNPSLGFFNT